MSLVGDALRKARHEAAQPRVVLPGIGVASSLAARRRSGRFGVGLALGAAIALAAAIGGAGAMWWLLGNHRGPADDRAQVAALPNRGDTSQELPHPGVPAGRAEAGTAAVTPVGTEPSSGPVAAGTVPSAPVGRPPIPPTSEMQGGTRHEAAALLADAAEAGARPEAPPGPAPAEKGIVQHPPKGAQERVFVVDADLGYAHLSLGFIAFRPSDAFAEINGREVRVGTVFDGFEVEEITSDAVRLRDAHGPIELRVR